MERLKILITTMMMTITLSVIASEDSYMNIYLNSTGKATSISIDEIDKITFPSEDEVLLTMNGIASPMLIDDIEVITFWDTDITSIEENEIESAVIEIKYLSGVEELHIVSPEPISMVQVYNMQGVQMITQIPNENSVSYNISAYPRGIYVVVVQANGQIATEKILK